MRKSAKLILTIFIVTILFSSITFAINIPLRVVVNGEELYFPDEKPFIDANGRTQTPARFIGEALGATVTWDGNAKK
ncbi:stalk domain-containing protein, partial [Acetivibrio straminisolvens]